MYIAEKILERISPFHAVQISDKSSGAFSVWPNITPEKSLHCGVICSTGPTLPRYWPNFTPNYGVMMSRWIFLFFLLIIVNRNPFYLEMVLWKYLALVSWHINFISRSYGWGVRARFVIFGCSLPHLTIHILFAEFCSEMPLWNLLDRYNGNLSCVCFKF